MTDTNSKIRPGIRATINDCWEGIIGVEYEPGWYRFGYRRDSLVGAYIANLKPIAFRLGDEVTINFPNVKTSLTGTVVAHNANPANVTICFSGDGSMASVPVDYLTLIDYPGKEEK